MTSVALWVARHQGRDLVRSRWVYAYAGFFLVVTEAMLRFGGDGTRTVVSLMNAVLLLVPLVSTVFGAMYLFNARDFIELLLAQPVSRRDLFVGHYLGLVLPLGGALAVGIGLPFVLRGHASDAGMTVLLASGLVLTAIFGGIAMWIAVRSDDRLRGLALAIGIWLGLALLYDGMVLMVASLFANYPIERPILGLMLANPIDLARVVLLLQLDTAALMGYTGALFQRAFGSAAGVLAAAVALTAWIACPLVAGIRAFARKDF